MSAAAGRDRDSVGEESLFRRVGQGARGRVRQHCWLEAKRPILGQNYGRGERSDVLSFGAGRRALAVQAQHRVFHRSLPHDSRVVNDQENGENQAGGTTGANWGAILCSLLLFSQTLHTPSFINRREYAFSIDLPPGTYVLVPCTFDPGQLARFYLTVYSEHRCEAGKVGHGSAPKEHVAKVSGFRFALVSILTPFSCAV